MNLLNIIYLFGAMALGFIFGMVVELMLDAETIRDLQNQNRKLRLELAQERKSPTVIEINDNRDTDYELPHYEDVVDFSQDW